MIRPFEDLAASHEFAGALRVPVGHARPLSPPPRPEAADRPAAELEAWLHTTHHLHNHTPEEGS